MQAPFKPAAAITAIAACLTLGACQTEAEPTELPLSQQEAVDAEAPGVGLSENGDAAYSADTDQPTIGEGSVDGEIGSPVAEPGQPITGDADLPANRATE